MNWWLTIFLPSVPVSQPVLTLRAPRAQAVVGDMMELHCEAWRGSPPILYRFYHEDVSLESCSSPSERGASCNLLLTAEHSGNYFCEADNGQGAQRSNTVSLTVRGKWTQLQHSQGQTISHTFTCSHDWRYPRAICCVTSLLYSLQLRVLYSTFSGTRTFPLLALPLLGAAVQGIVTKSFLMYE